MATPFETEIYSAVQGGRGATVLSHIEYRKMRALERIADTLDHFGPLLAKLANPLLFANVTPETASFVAEFPADDELVPAKQPEQQPVEIGPALEHRRRRRGTPGADG